MEVKNLLSKKRLLLPPGGIPWDSLLAPSNREEIRNTFKFDALNVAEKAGTPFMHGVLGQIVFKEKIRAILEMNLQPTALEVLVDGETDVADYLIQAVQDLLGRLSTQPPTWELEPRETTYETFCVCRLEVDCWLQISDAYGKFVQNAVFPKIVDMYQNAEPFIQPGSIQFRVLFKMKVPHHMIGPKLFAIEPREGVPPEDRIFWTTSPLRSELHLEILSEFEKTICSGFPETDITTRRGHKSPAS